MIKPEQIPSAALEAGAISLRGGWGEADEAEKAAYLEAARAAFLAMIEAWEGRERDRKLHCQTDGTCHFSPRIILPLPTEASDE